MAGQRHIGPEEEEPRGYKCGFLIYVMHEGSMALNSVGRRALAGSGTLTEPVSGEMPLAAG